MVAQLKAFRHDFGHCNVPNAWPRNRELAAWLHGVRCNNRSGRLDADRVRQLNALGIVWEPKQTRWEKMFAALEEYRQLHGDCNVPFGWPEDPALAKWVKGMRAAQKRGDLDDEQFQRLDAIGFGWERGESRWEEMFAELANYRHVHGHCRISTLSEEYRALGNWVHTQRTLHKQGRLEKERIARLDALGFTWDIRRERWDTMFAATSGLPRRERALRRSANPVGRLHPGQLGRDAADGLQGGPARRRADRAAPGDRLPLQHCRRSGSRGPSREISPGAPARAAACCIAAIRNVIFFKSTSKPDAQARNGR